MFNAFDVSLIAPIAGTVVADVDKPVIKGVKYGIQDIPGHHATHEIIVFIDAVDLQDYFGPDGLGYQTRRVYNNAIGIVFGFFRKANGLIIISNFPVNVGAGHLPGQIMGPFMDHKGRSDTCGKLKNLTQLGGEILVLAVSRVCIQEDGGKAEYCRQRLLHSSQKSTNIHRTSFPLHLLWLIIFGTVGWKTNQ